MTVQRSLLQTLMLDQLSQDGQTVGKLDGLDIAANGLVSANYTNGLNIALGRLSDG